MTITQDKSVEYITQINIALLCHSIHIMIIDGNISKIWIYAFTNYKYNKFFITFDFKKFATIITGKKSRKIMLHGVAWNFNNNCFSAFLCSN